MKKTWLIIIILVVVSLAGGVVYFLANQAPQPKTQSGRKSSDIKKSGIEGLVAYWSFNEGQGTNSVDLSNSLKARITGATWTTGKKGNALRFDGKDDFVEFEQSALKLVGSLDYGTISLWFKFKNPGPQKILPLFYLGRKDVPGETIDNLTIEIGHFNHGTSPDTKLYYTVYNQSFEPILCFDSGVNLKADTWYHFTVVNNPSGNTGYLDGVELTNRHYNFSNAKDTRFFATLHKKDTFQLGHGWFGIDQKFHFFEGTIDEVKVYNKPLTATEIKILATP